jgi:hypothetical protein
MKTKLLLTMLALMTFCSSAYAQSYKLSYTFKTFKFHADSFSPESLTPENIETYQEQDFIADSNIEVVTCTLVNITNTYFCEALRFIEKIETGIGAGSFCEAVAFAKSELSRRQALINTEIRIRDRIITRPIIGAMSIYLTDDTSPVCSIMSNEFSQLVRSKQDNYFDGKRYTNKKCGCEDKAYSPYDVEVNSI